ncbi:MAG TPA: CRTAC1 family protein, partial [Geminicoccaceae bacterium]|nr:CRTAC1 family protein [Geminicoccaceae bacterium]
NELGPNFLFRARGDGTYEEVAERAGVADPLENGRGVALLDANGDGRLDLVCGNWEGPHRLFIQGDRAGFIEAAPLMMAAPSRVRTVIAADFDNDGFEEIFFNNMGEPNRLFGWREGGWRPIDLGAALEPSGLGTGAAVGDFDGDGRLELLIAHGEAAEQPLGYYEALDLGHAWLRVLPRTRRGAPARGALVTLRAGGRRRLRVIDSGSGYLCQMEPVAHFGLGVLGAVEGVEVRWPDGAVAYVDAPPVRQTIEVPHPAG